ncbi:hypothetical protein ACK3SF_05665 [Candidatus Nanosalina sp. VS9-1]|uniref:hypothetical protein n=1 Tax=Candidatus Nanosalina sp. VS9-1 TaxID=3388566 RepID=UPI0039E06F3F
MKARENSDIADVLYVLALAVFLTGLASGTSITPLGDGMANDETVQPDSTGVGAFSFNITYGGDENISGSPVPGAAVYSFEDNSTMFLNQSGEDKGLNGYGDGEDILGVVREHVGDKASVLNSTAIANFSSDVYFLDGGVDNNSVFDGNNSTAGFAGEIVLRTDSGLVDRSAEVLASGNFSSRTLHSDVRYVESNGNGQFDGGVYGTEILVNSSDNVLDSSDRVIDLGSEFYPSQFEADTTRYLEQNGSQIGFVASSAIVREEGSKDDTLERSGDVIKRDGKADLLWANETTLLYADQGDGAFTSGDPIYYSQENNNYVNASDIRLGNYDVSSRPSSTGISLGLNLLSVMNSSDSHPETNDLGKSLSVYSGGSFRVLEYGSSTGSWNPGDSVDQDVIVYDTEDDGLSEGDILLYNQDPDNGTVEASVGTEFTQSDVDSTDSPAGNYTKSGELGYNDTDEDGYYTAGDQVVLNISDSAQDYVVLGPEGEAGTLISDDYNDTLGNISRWDVDTSSNSVFEDGLYVAMNDTGQVSTGDVRLGHWNSTVKLGDKDTGNGTVEEGDLDQGAVLDSFTASDNVAALDRNNKDVYDAGIGRLSDNEQGREALISTTDEFLNDTDDIIREGRMPSAGFDSNIRYFDSDDSTEYEEGEAIVDATNGFGDGSDVIVPGSAGFAALQAETKYMETGSTGFDPAVDPLVHDAGRDGLLRKGSLDRADTSGSDDYVYTEFEGNLQNFNRSLNETGMKKTVFLDSQSSGADEGVYNAGEDILEVELVTNGSASDSFDGEEIFNFADSTRHTAATYSDGEKIVNDTDRNGVYQNVVQDIEISNVVDVADYPEFFTEANDTAINSGLRVYRHYEDTREEVGVLGYDGGLKWSSGVSENITNDTKFSVEFDSAPAGDLGDMLHGFKGETSQISLAGGSVGTVTSEDVQVIDGHAPELVEAWTGNRNGGESTATSKVFVKTNEQYSGLDYGSHITPGRFNIVGEDLLVDSALGPDDTNMVDGNNIVLVLNESVQTNKTFDVEIAEGEFIQDNAANSRSDDSVYAQDGLKPQLETQVYRDVNEDGKVDLIELNFSENISYSAFSSDDWNVTEEELSGLTVDSGTAGNNDTLELEASADENITGVKESEPFLDYEADAVVDNSGNTLNDFNRTLADMAAPVIFNATTGDDNRDARIDRIGLNFTEPLDDQASELLPDSFSIGDAGEVEGVVSGESDDSELDLEISSERGTDSSPSVTMFSEAIRDSSGNSIDEEQVFAGTVDTTNPVLLNAQINHGQSSYANTFVNVRFSEPVKGDREQINLSSKALAFQNTDSAQLHTVEYGEILPTGNSPNVTGITNITDSSGNTAVLEASDNVTVNSFRKQMVEGWNFVSFPIADETTPAIEKVIDTSKIDVVWTYRNSQWQTYDPEASQNDFTEFEGGVGYMIKASEDFVLNPNVNTVRTHMTGRDLANASTGLANGYNLIGTFQEHTVPADNSETGAFGALDTTHVDTVYEQSSAGSRQVDTVRDSTGNSPGEMSPGEAYWLNWEGDSASYSEPVVDGGG